MRDISPVEIDHLAAALKANNEITDGDYMMMLTKGADFLSHLPGDYYTADKLHAKSDIVGQLEGDIGHAAKRGDPVEALSSLLEFFKAFDARRTIPASGLVT